MFDENGDGKINKTELAAVLENDDLEAVMGSDLLSRILQDQRLKTKRPKLRSPRPSTIPPFLITG
eukprot:5551291-Amphidinium_carterae.1